MSPEAFLAACDAQSRDNARTPMQWNDAENGGFTTGTPWLPVNPNHREINSERQLADPDSVFHHYRKLIALRHDLDVVTHGDFTLLLPDDERIWAYTRRHDGTELLVLANLSSDEATVVLDDADIVATCELLLGNIPGRSPAFEGEQRLAPWEALVYLSRS
jgi:oligo-1,6-glucosidase